MILIIENNGFQADLICAIKFKLIYGKSHTVYTDFEFRIFALNVVSYISKQIGCKFFVDDATEYLEHRSIEKLKQYIDDFEVPDFESPDLSRKSIIDKQNQK